ncbi:Tn3 family transposase [Streptomyces sp. NPDC102365]|uniref:Tn3 family transposase n=1 Tax=Streptomyces sp. NPDC102365 TaxID=3366162 RepID=UPI0038036014
MPPSSAFREVGRVICTVQLPRYLSDAPPRRRVTAATNKVEAVNGFSQWIGFGTGGVITDNDPVAQERTVKFNPDVDFSPLRGDDPGTDGYGQAA